MNKTIRLSTFIMVSFIAGCDDSSTTEKTPSINNPPSNSQVITLPSITGRDIEFFLKNEVERNKVLQKCSKDAKQPDCRPAVNAVMEIKVKHTLQREITAEAFLTNPIAYEQAARYCKIDGELSLPADHFICKIVIPLTRRIYEKCQAEAKDVVFQSVECGENGRHFESLGLKD